METIKAQRDVLMRSINGSFHSAFLTGCYDFLGSEEAFKMWCDYKIKKVNGNIFYKGYRDFPEVYIEGEIFEEIKKKFMSRYYKRMKSIYWSNQVLRT